jgi:hypothetical protein
MSDTPPDPHQLKVAIGSFTTDAKFWHDLGDTIDKASAGAQGLTINSLAFGPAAPFGIADKYNEVQQMVVDRCKEGGVEFREIAKKLIKARDEYQKAEDDNTHAIKHSW